MEILLTKPKHFKIGAWLIKTFIRRGYSHVAIAYTDAVSNEKMVFHAANGVVHPITYDNFLKHNDVVKSIDLRSTPTGVYKFINENSGLTYDFASLAFIPIKKLLPFIKFKNYSGYICSELAADFLENYYGIIFNKPHNLIDPGEIEDALNGAKYN